MNSDGHWKWPWPTARYYTRNLLKGQEELTPARLGPPTFELYMKTTAYWVVTPCSFVDGQLRFGEQTASIFTFRTVAQLHCTPNVCDTETRVAACLAAGHNRHRLTRPRGYKRSPGGARQGRLGGGAALSLHCYSDQLTCVLRQPFFSRPALGPGDASPLSSMIQNARRCTSIDR